jgi:hypothetical protein
MEICDVLVILPLETWKNAVLNSSIQTKEKKQKRFNMETME